VLPTLSEFRHDAVQSIARAAANLESENDLLNEVAICDLVEVAEQPRHPLDHSYGICYQDFRHLSDNRRSNLIRFWLRSLQLHTPSKRLMSDLLVMFDDNPASTTVLQEDNWQFRFYHGYMYVMPALDAEFDCITLEWQNLDQPLDIYDRMVRVDATNKLRELIHARQPRHVRLVSRHELDNPKALQGHSLNLKKWFQEIGVPPWRRQALPLLTFEQSGGNVVLGPVCQQVHNDWVSLGSLQVVGGM
jgi:tRNA(Ile)-lysidine synthase